MSNNQPKIAIPGHLLPAFERYQEFNFQLAAGYVRMALGSTLKCDAIEAHRESRRRWSEFNDWLDRTV